MTIGIYKFTNIINGKSYIGQSVDIERRYKEHLNRSNNNNQQEYNSYLHQSIRKYGIENFNFQIIEQCSINELDNKEIYWIKYFNTVRPNGYNLTYGGNLAKESFIKYSPELIQQIREILQNTEMRYEDIKKIYGVSLGFIADLNNGKIHVQENLNYPLRQKSLSTGQKCPICGQKKDYHSTYCYNCYIKEGRKSWPSKEELKSLIRNEPFTKIGKMFHVSDNAVRKWCNNYNLPTRKKDIKQYSDEEWQYL